MQATARLICVFYSARDSDSISVSSTQAKIRFIDYKRENYVTKIKKIMKVLIMSYKYFMNDLLNYYCMY